VRTKPRHYPGFWNASVAFLQLGQAESGMKVELEINRGALTRFHLVPLLPLIAVRRDQRHEANSRQQIIKGRMKMRK
jgi:hypothetical protein